VTLSKVEGSKGAHHPRREDGGYSLRYSSDLADEAEPTEQSASQRTGWDVSVPECRHVCRTVDSSCRIAREVL
jgi:hypothetical protein